MKILLGCMLVVLFFTGCGDDEVDPSQPVTIRLYSEPALDRLVTSDGRIEVDPGFRTLCYSVTRIRKGARECHRQNAVEEARS